MQSSASSNGILCNQLTASSKIGFIVTTVTIDDGVDVVGRCVTSKIDLGLLKMRRGTAAVAYAKRREYIIFLAVKNKSVCAVHSPRPRR